MWNYCCLYTNVGSLFHQMLYSISGLKKRGNKTFYMNKNFKWFRTCTRVRGASPSQCVHLELSWSVWTPSVWKRRQELSWGFSDIGASLPIWKNCGFESSMLCTLCNHLYLQRTKAKKVQNARGLQGFSTLDNELCIAAQSGSHPSSFADV